MVTVIDAIEIANSEGDTFVSLILQGGITMIQSKSSGKFYATTKRTRIASTFALEDAKHMIGEKIPGSIEKVSCEPYEYSVPNSDEVVTLDFTYQFVSEGSNIKSPVVTNQLQTDAEMFSTNGEQELVEA
tara:strand:+ start:704 stop:1093 length:390 start_codon:yes stop_codon:yes gene_type:complete